MSPQIIGNGHLTARLPAHFAAVLEALQLHGASAETLRELDDDAWLEVLALCDRANLTLPLALRAYSGFPAWVTQRLQRNLADSSDHFKLTQATYIEAASTLAGAGVPWVVLKGFAQTPDFAASPQFRRQGDIDIYTPREFVTSAVQALQSVGYNSNQQDDYRLADHSPTLMRFGNWKPSPNLYDPETPLCIEVHFCLWNNTIWMISLPEVEKFWARRIQRSLGLLDFPALNPVDHLGYFALHVLREIFGAGRVVHRVLELATFFDTRSNDASFWNEWKSLHSPELRQAEVIAMALAADWFAAALPLAVREEIDSLPAGLLGWIEGCGASPLIAMDGRTRDGRLLQMLLARSAGSRWKILRRALSPVLVTGPSKLAQRPVEPSKPQEPRKNRHWTYLVYLTSRTWLNGMAVLRFIAHGFELCVSLFTLRRVEP